MTLSREPLLEQNMSRFSLFPIQYRDIWDLYQTHLQLFWTVNEVDLSQDVKDWTRLTSDEQQFIKYVLAFFQQADNIVSENLATRFYNDVQIPEARAFYSFQIAIEQIHSNQYSLLIETLIQDKSEQQFLFNGIQNIPCLERKANWILKYINNQDSFPTRLIAFACVEGIMFSGSFCAIYWLKKRGLMPGLCQSNDFISRDESIHRDFACLLYSHIQNKLSIQSLTQIVIESVDIEKQFVSEALSVSLIGMNADLMCQYIEFVADHLLYTLNVPKYFNVENPFDFMNMISLQGKTNFFERHVTEYQKSNTDKLTLQLDNDF